MKSTAFLLPPTSYGVKEHSRKESCEGITLMMHHSHHIPDAINIIDSVNVDYYCSCT